MLTSQQSIAGGDVTGAIKRAAKLLAFFAMSFIAGRALAQTTLTDTMVSGSPSGSVSLASTSLTTATSSSVVAISSTAMGVSLTGATVTVTVVVPHWLAGLQVV